MFLLLRLKSNCPPITQAMPYVGHIPCREWVSQQEGERCVLRTLKSFALQMLLKDAAPKKGQAFTYNYDMTDPWSHIVDVLSIADGGDLTTKLVDGERAGIPEVLPFLDSVPDFA